MLILALTIDTHIGSVLQIHWDHAKLHSLCPTAHSTGVAATVTEFSHFNSQCGYHHRIAAVNSDPLWGLHQDVGGS